MPKLSARRKNISQEVRRTENQIHPLVREYFIHLYNVVFISNAYEYLLINFFDTFQVWFNHFCLVFFLQSDRCRIYVYEIYKMTAI